MNKEKVPKWEKPKASPRKIDVEIFPKTKALEFRAKIIENVAKDKKGRKQNVQYVVKIPKKVVEILGIKKGDYLQFNLPENIGMLEGTAQIEVTIMRGED